MWLGGTASQVCLGFQRLPWRVCRRRSYTTPLRLGRDDARVRPHAYRPKAQQYHRCCAPSQHNISCRRHVATGTRLVQVFAGVHDGHSMQCPSCRTEGKAWHTSNCCCCQAISHSEDVPCCASLPRHMSIAACRSTSLKLFCTYLEHISSHCAA
jgi:hypothetical protein